MRDHSDGSSVSYKWSGIWWSGKPGWSLMVWKTWKSQGISFSDFAGHPELGRVTGKALIIDLQIICVSMDEEPQLSSNSKHIGIVENRNTMGRVWNLEARRTASLLLWMLTHCISHTASFRRGTIANRLSLRHWQHYLPNTICWILCCIAFSAANKRRKLTLHLFSFHLSFLFLIQNFSWTGHFCNLVNGKWLLIIIIQLKEKLIFLLKRILYIYTVSRIVLYLWLVLEICFVKIIDRSIGLCMKDKTCCAGPGSDNLTLLSKDLTYARQWLEMAYNQGRERLLPQGNARGRDASRIFHSMLRFLFF